MPPPSWSGDCVQPVPRCFPRMPGHERGAPVELVQLCAQALHLGFGFFRGDSSSGASGTRKILGQLPHVFTQGV